MEIALRKHFEEIIPLTDQEFDYILSHFTPKKLKKHQFLVQTGDEVKHTYWVKQGLLLATYTDENDREYIIQFAMENWWITDYQAYFTKIKAITNVQCLENSELLGLSFENREKLCREMHKMEHFFRRKANSGYVALQKRMLSLMADSAQKRYEILISQYPNLVQRVSKATLAAYLGVSRETLSRFGVK